MKHTPFTEKLVSAVLGVIGAFWLITLAAAFTTLTLHESLLKLGCGLSCISLAFDPAIVFRPVTLAAARQPLRRAPAAMALSIVGAVCLLLSGAVWLAS